VFVDEATPNRRATFLPTCPPSARDHRATFSKAFAWQEIRIGAAGSAIRRRSNRSAMVPVYSVNIAAVVAVQPP